MKKGLIIIAAALFVAAMVLPAMAVDMSLSGFYRVRGFYQSNADGGVVTPWDSGTDYTGAGDYAGDPEAWWDHHLQLNPVFKIADNLKLVTRVSMFNNQMWGSSESSGAIATTGAVGNAASFGDEADNIIWNRAYIEWATPKGTLKIGRMAGNFTFFLPFGNTELDADRIIYVSPAYSGFNVVLGHEKRVEGSVSTDQADADHDRYFAILQYACPGLYVGYAPDMFRDRATNDTFSDDKFNHNFCLKLNDPTNTYFFEGELQLRKGDRTYDAAGKDYDYDGLGYYAAVGMRKGPLTVALAAAFCSGDEGDDVANPGRDREAGTPFGLDFQPLYILTSPYSNITTSQTGGYGFVMENLGGTNVHNTGAKAYVLAADYQVDPELALHAAVGMAYADKTAAGVDDEFGKEFDLGLKYQIMSNLAYELHLGYLWTGDLFKQGASNYHTDDIYQIDHSLTLSF